MARLPRRSAYRVAGGSRAVLQRHAHERRDGYHGGPLHASVFVQFLNITRRNAEEQEEQSARRQSMLKIMGLDEHESLADMRQAP